MQSIAKNYDLYRSPRMPTGETITNAQMSTAFFTTCHSFGIFAFRSRWTFLLGTDFAPLTNMCIRWNMLAKQPRNGSWVPTRTWDNSVIWRVCTFCNQGSCQTVSKLQPKNLLGQLPSFAMHKVV